MEANHAAWGALRMSREPETSSASDCNVHSLAKSKRDLKELLWPCFETTFRYKAMDSFKLKGALECLVA